MSLNAGQIEIAKRKAGTKRKLKNETIRKMRRNIKSDIEFVPQFNRYKGYK